MIDFHCHIDLYSDPEAVLQEADARGVYILAVTTTPKAWKGTCNLTKSYSRVRVGLGLHPELVAERHSEVALFEHLVNEARYIGEVGLDGGVAVRGSFKKQEEVLSRILRCCATAGGRVLSMHSRHATSGVLEALERCPEAGLPILHWFTGSSKELMRAIELQCWFSVGPAMLHTKKGRTLVEMMPPERVLTETDAPFAKAAGRPLMPWNVDQTYGALADIWKRDVPQVQAQLAENLRIIGAHAVA